MTSKPNRLDRNPHRLRDLPSDRQSMRSTGGCAGTPLSRSAHRLLSALKDDGATAATDPTGTDQLVVRRSAAGISLGGGSFPVAAGDELLSAGLVEKAGTRGRLAISEAGSAHLRRLSAPDPAEAFAVQHRDIAEERVEIDGASTAVSRNAAESPLDWLRRRKDRDGEPLIDPASYEAGERLRRDLTFGGILPSVTARWDAALGSGGGAIRDPAAATDVTIAARQRVRRALDEVGGDFADILVDLCGFLKGLELIERERGWPPRSGKVVVRLALRRLAEHYGLEVEARGPRCSRGIRIWHEDEELAAR